jgi:hypothetical protein
MNAENLKNYNAAAIAFAGACEKYELTAETVSAPKAETREDNWDCVSWEVSYKARGREFHRSKFSQGLGHFKADKMTLEKYANLGTGVRDMRYHTLKHPLQAEGVAKMYETLAEKKGLDLKYALSCVVADVYTSLYRLSFADFCAEYGYNKDSRKAEKTYEAVRESGDALIRAIGEDAARELYELSSQL